MHALLLLFMFFQQPAANALAPITVYNGSWQMTSAHTLAGPGKPDHLVNTCTATGHFYVCEQVVNGKFLAMITFIAADQPGHFYTQALLPDGHAAGRSELTIAHEAKGEHWTYLSSSTDGSKTTHYRVENYFPGPDKIHFEQYESVDGTQWELKNSGDEQRMP